MPTSTSATSKRRSPHTRAAAAPVVSHSCSIPSSSSWGSSSCLELLAADDEHAGAACADGGAEHVAQLVGVDRLGHDPLARQLLTTGEHRHEQDRGRAQIGIGADRAQYLETVHPGHQDVERDRVVVARAKLCEGLLAACDDRRLDVERRQLAGDQLGDLALVVDDQHTAAADRLERAAVLGPGHGGRKHYCERGPAAGLRIDLDPALMQVDERLDDRQAESRAGPLRAGCAAVGNRRPAVEAFEHAPDLVLGHPDPRVLDDDLHPRPVRLDADVETSAFRGVEVGVGEQVGNDLAHATCVGERERQRGGDVHAELLVSLRDPGPHQLGNFAHGLADVDRPTVDLDMVGLDPRYVEQIVDEVDQPVGGAQDDLDELALTRRHVLRRAGEQLHEPLDRRQRAAELVRRGRDELRLRALEPRALGHVADGPDDAVMAAAERCRGDRQRPSVVLDDRLRRQRRVERRQRAARCVDPPRRDKLGQELRGARIDGGDRRRARAR